MNTIDHLDLIHNTSARAIEALPSLALAMMAPTPDDFWPEIRAYERTLISLAHELGAAHAMHVHNSLCDALVLPEDTRRSVTKWIARTVSEVTVADALDLAAV